MKKTILLDGEPVGRVVSFELFGQREVSYWIGQDISEFILVYGQHSG